MNPNGPPYPGQGFPPQGYPPQGMGMPPQGYPPQGMGMPPQGYPPQGMGMGMPPQGYPPQGMGMPPMGMVPPRPMGMGMTPQGMGMGMPPQGMGMGMGMPPQGMGMGMGFNPHGVVPQGYAMRTYALPKHVIKESKQLFKRHDRDHSKSINMMELYPLMTETFARAGLPPPQQNDLLYLLQKYDMNRDGTINKKEFKYMLKEMGGYGKYDKHSIMSKMHKGKKHKHY